MCVGSTNSWLRGGAAAVAVTPTIISVRKKMSKLMFKRCMHVTPGSFSRDQSGAIVLKTRLPMLVGSHRAQHD